MQALTSPKISPTHFGERAALQVAACGLCSPATGGTGAAASCGVARAASRDDRERPTVPLGTAHLSRTRPLCCFSAGLRAVAATGLTIGQYCAGFILRQALQGSVQVLADGTTTPPRPSCATLQRFLMRQ